MELLENPAWHALTGPHANVAERNGPAVRYQPEVAVFAALPDVTTPAAWRALAELLGPDGVAMLFRRELDAPSHWEELFRASGDQMVLRDGASRDGGTDDTRIEVLGAADVDDMLGLVERTRPGPFERRTIELGTYLGIRDRDALVAMAGERLHLAGYTEISAVCTEPAHQGRGLATALVLALVRRVRARGERPFLHVVTENAGAIRLYQSLGFERTRTMQFVAFRAK